MAPTTRMSCTSQLWPERPEEDMDQKKPIHTLLMRMSSTLERVLRLPRDLPERNLVTTVSSREVSTGSSTTTTPRECSKETSHTVPPGRTGTSDTQTMSWTTGIQTHEYPIDLINNELFKLRTR